MDAERVLNERDPTQQAIDQAVIEDAQTQVDHRDEDLAIRLHNSLHKAFH